MDASSRKNKFLIWSYFNRLSLYWIFLSIVILSMGSIITLFIGLYLLVISVFLIFTTNIKLKYLFSGLILLYSLGFLFLFGIYLYVTRSFYNIMISCIFSINVIFNFLIIGFMFRYLNKKYGDITKYL